MATMRVVKTFCNACWNKRRAEVDAVERLTLGDLEWDLCEVHRDRFGQMLGEALDVVEPIAVSA